jgi:hypothetical protein
MLPEQNHVEGDAIVALAGRQIDASDIDQPRFPIEAVPTVRRRLAQLLGDERAKSLVCSAACGADLIALDEAERLGLRRRIVLPFPPQRFRETSVIDRPGNWGPLFDHHIAAAAAADDLVVLSDQAGGDEAAYVAANEAIIREAQTLARDGAAHRLVAVLVWEEAAKSGIDATAGFRELAVKAGFQERSVQTLEEATLARRADREAKDYLKGAALTPEHAVDLIKRLKKADRFGWARRVIAKIRKTSVGNSALGIWFVQQHALCTYKDPDLPVLKALVAHIN